MADERGDMMMMVVPTYIFLARNKYISGYCFPDLIRKFSKLTPNVFKCALDDC